MPPLELTQPVSIRWADLDPNGHVRHSVYYDWAAAVRITFLESQGLGLEWMTRHAIGPVLFREEARFRKEARFGDQLTMDLSLAGASADGRKWRIRHHLMKGPDLAATVEVDGAWLDLRARKIVTPPPELMRAFADVPRPDDFAVLPSSKAP